MKNYIILCLTGASLMNACPMKIVNDGIEPIFISDMNSKQGLLLLPGHSGFIDPMIQGWFKWFKKERLRIYVPSNQQGNFHGAYVLMEHYCSPQTTRITFSEIKEWAMQRSERFSVTFDEYKPKEAQKHN